MAKIELEINDAALNNARSYAEASGTTLEGMLAALIRLNFREAIEPSATIGLFADMPEVVNQMMEDVREARRSRAEMKGDIIAEDAA